MKKFTIIALLALFVVTGLTSCKYEDGPFISFIPKVERVANTWVVDQEFKNDTLTTGDHYVKQIIFYKEGNCSLTLTVIGFDILYTGDWAFTDDKSAITIAVVDGSGFTSVNETYTILRLKEKEMWVTYTDSDNVKWTLHMLPKDA
ncbi:MAG: hypothetical protein H6581_09450 [Bacteroidia bacterium]|nr:hypothetical protein [Bacteroidia bacterium]